VFLSSDDSPEITPVFAESPSQKIIIQSFDLSVPAQLASSSLGIPLIDLLLVPSVFFAALLSFTSVICKAASITPIFATFSINLSVTSHFDPNLEEGVFIKSFVWLSNAGFSISHLKNKINCSLILLGLTFTFFFFSIYSPSFFVIWFKIYSTCLPPLEV